MKRCAIVILVATFATVALTYSANAQTMMKPPNGVYTCDWIAQHPAAASAALVSCDPSGPPLASSNLPLPIGGTPDSTEAQGCQVVPNGGARVGQGVFAWSQYEYANYWSYFAEYAPANYTWYLHKQDGTNYTYGTVTDTSSHNVGVPANIYRWGAQNHSTTPENWYVCYTVR